ncbi:hypothetical protein NJT12_20805 [Flavobacterium sp. AC]|uniref:Uncharacterized protein n=1 Tax=Flavobacterium azizsancarii TaxID=2961580 RepID=A0ABT4WJ41_9FLAO|nr:hypothetical protein [Flavobacterium azizsancarii]MDA6072070.1 hypothetical protein [Flavobacterium azizsancarii]
MTPTTKSALLDAVESPFGKLFLLLQEHIKTEVPEVMYIEQDLGQLGTDDPRNCMSFPGVLIDFPNTPFSNLQGKNQLANPVISITLVFDNYSQTWQDAPLDVRKTGLKYLEVEQKIFMAIQNLESDFCEALNRTAATGHNRNDVGLRVRELTFTSEFEDYSCDDDSQRIQVSLRTE